MKPCCTTKCEHYKCGFSKLLGEFGVVYRADLDAWQGMSEYTDIVAVKTLKGMMFYRYLIKMSGNCPEVILIVWGL